MCFFWKSPPLGAWGTQGPRLSLGPLPVWTAPRLKQTDVTQRAPPGVQLEVGAEEAAVGREGMSGLRGGERPG